jgi:hypothetical protein
LDRDASHGPLNAVRLRHLVSERLEQTHTGKGSLAVDNVSKENDAGVVLLHHESDIADEGEHLALQPVTAGEPDLPGSAARIASKRGSNRSAVLSFA